MAVHELTHNNPDGWRTGQSASDKGAFFGATPVVQQTSPVVSALTTASATTTALAAAVVAIREDLRDIVSVLETLGLTA